MPHLLQELLTLSGLISLLTLAVMEIVLGIDNIIFISILAGKLPAEMQNKARTIGLALAFVFRVALLMSISWIVGLKDPFITLFGFGLSGRDIILIAGGAFLLANTTTEIHSKLEGEGEEEDGLKAKSIMTLRAAIIQIILLDIVFSFDSILTAVGLVDNVLTMILAVMIALLIMMKYSKAISDYVNTHPTIRMLALSFLLMIGVLLIVEGFHIEVPKTYVYSAMGFSLLVEYLNMRSKPEGDPVVLHNQFDGITDSELKKRKLIADLEKLTGKRIVISEESAVEQPTEKN